MSAKFPSPDRLLSTAFAFRQSQVLLAAVALGVFPALRNGALRLDALVDKLALHGRGARDFLDALVSLDLLGRDANGQYHNVPECAAYLDPDQSTYVGGVLEYLSGSNYQAWSGLAAATGARRRPHRHATSLTLCAACSVGPLRRAWSEPIPLLA